ncbi:MAG: ABC transporter ATP-binding protein [Clostridia bacterium]|nr:ABC transporter ATP-binding protein [Clostridia bacterium]
MKRLLKHLKKYTLESILAPLFKLFEAALELIVPLVVAVIIDDAIGGGDKGYAVILSLVLVLLGLIGLGFSVVAQYCAAKASVGFITSVRTSLFSHLQTLSYSDVDRIGTSTMITRMTTDANILQTGLNLSLRLLSRSPIVVFGAMIMAFTIDSYAGGIFAAVIPLLSVIVFGIMIITMPMYKRVQGGVDKILGRTRENLAGVRVIRAFGKEDDEFERFKEENSLLTKQQKRVGHISALMNPLTYAIINLALILLIDVGALRVNSGNLTQGEVIALYNYMSQILIELIKLANLIITITKALASASRISSVFDITPTQAFGDRTKGVDNTPAVDFNNVFLSYNGGENSISGISFKAERGETVGIIGGTGSGKSTLVNLISRFYDATDGAIYLFGAPIKEYTKSALTSKIGVVPQKAVLFSGTIRDNMRWGNPDAKDDEIMAALKIAQAEGVARDKGGLDGKVEAGGKNFSGGQRQRLTIARALVSDPDILILDDSASALDFATDAALRAAIKELKNKTVFIVSQRASSVMYADKIIVLDDGECVDIGTHEELIARSPIYKEIYESQYKKEAAV